MGIPLEIVNHFPLHAGMYHGFQGWTLQLHSHVELLYVLEGKIPVTVEGVTHNVAAGEAALLFPYLPHSYGNAPEATCILLTFDPVATAFDNTLLTQKPVCWWQDVRVLQPIFERIVIVRKKKLAKAYIGYLNALLGELLDILELAPRNIAVQNTVVRILSYCEEHYTEDITEQSVAEALHISRSYVSSVFSNRLQPSFREYINSLRTKKAQTLLRDTDKKILEIMLECGFRNQGSFNRVFRKQTNLSPSEYRAAL